MSYWVITIQPHILGTYGEINKEALNVRILVFLAYMNMILHHWPELIFICVNRILPRYNGIKIDSILTELFLDFVRKI